MRELARMDRKDTILLVDDEKMIKQRLKDAICKDFDILEASNGLEALKVLSANSDKVAVIVLDLVMPVMDGLQFMETFRRYREYDNIPVIVATSNEDWHTEQRCLEAGVWDFVMKPYNPDLLRFRIKNVIDRSRMIMVERDTVTRLYTKYKFYRAVHSILSEETDDTFAFVRIDIDRFKMINNFYGVKEGDRVLQSVASELRRISTAFDRFVYGRVENDVFAVCMPFQEENIELLVKALQINLRRANKDYNIKISCGVYVINDDAMEVSEMYDRAFLAAKSCKGKFSQSIAYYNESMVENMRQEQFVINEVNRAIDEEQFEVYLQPKIDLTTDCSYGAEALVRWKHPEKGMIAPDEFIPVYEKNGIIGKLDQYMWRSVCKLLRRWLDEGREPNPISVNVSRVNIYNPHLVKILRKLITEYQIPPELLNLELTESAFIEDQDLVMNTMSSLRRLGFKIMMDDFGSGYSSLNVLKDIEVDYLKVDMKFLQDQELSGKAEKVLTSVIRMAKWLHLPSIVEGVETPEQVDFLKCIGCEYAQGYYYAKPLTVAEYEQYIAREEELGVKSSADENVAIINDLWNTRSSVSRLFDMLETPIAVYEYRNEKIELLRTNTRYDADIVFEKETDEGEYARRIQQEKESLRETFARVARGDFCEPMEYELREGIWYRATVRMIGKRADTMLMMVTLCEISAYMQGDKR